MVPRSAVMQAHDRDLRAVQLGQLRHGRGQDAGGGRVLRLAAGGVSMLCHRSGRSPAGGAVMPWPSIPSLAHSPASCPGTGLSGGSTPAACSAATM